MEEKSIVTLVQMGDFTFDENAYKTVDKKVFDMLVDVKSEPDGYDASKAEVLFFKNKVEYANNSWKYPIDETKPIYVNDKGQIFCFRAVK